MLEISKVKDQVKNSFYRKPKVSFSLLTPTRKRVSYLKKLCSSIANTAYDTQDLELLVACDDDDQDTHNMKLNYPWVSLFSRPRINNISAYFNWLYLHSCGKYIWVLNDDVEILTDNWDSIIKEKLSKYEIVYGRARHNGWNEQNPWSPFPILTREAIEAVGFVMDERQPGWSADSYLYKVYLTADCICDIPDVHVNHSGCGDETHENMVKLSAKGCDTTNHEADVVKLKKAKVKPEMNDLGNNDCQKIKELINKFIKDYNSVS